MLKRAIPAAAATAVLAFVPSAFAATITSGDPLTVQGQSDVSQNWEFDDASGDGTVDGYFHNDPVAYDSETAPLPATCTDYDSGDANTDTPGEDTSASGSGNGVAYIVRCTDVTKVVANAGDASANIDAAVNPRNNDPIGLRTTPIDITGGTGGDSLQGGAANDNISGGDGNDWVAGGAGDDKVDFGAGDDEGVGGPGDDTVDAGDGNDDWVAGGPGNDTIKGGAGDDYIVGDCDSSDNCPNGEDGNDTIDAGDGNDHVSGDGGNDAINAGAGDDYAYGDVGDDTLEMGDGRDSADGGAGNDHVNGGPGDDGVSDWDAGGPILLSQGIALPYLVGGEGNDVVTGGDGNDVILNEPGSDTLQGQAGDDIFVEGLFFSGPGDAQPDTIQGGDGTDTFQYWATFNWGAGPAQTGVSIQPQYALTATLDGQANDATVDDNPDSPDDTDNNYDVENLQVLDSLFPFGGFDDISATIIGNDSANVLSGTRQADTLIGNAGPDRLEAFGGDDKINSRDGYPDYVDCGEGTDAVTGDEYDTYVRCENVDSVQMRSAYDKVDPAQVPETPPIVLPPDKQGPKTGVTTKTRLTSEQLLNGITVGVNCPDEACTIEGRLLGSQPVGSKASTAALHGFNVVLGRKSAGLAKGKRNIKITPCVRKSAKAAASCRDRLRASWKRKKTFTVKVQVTTRDAAGNRTRKTKLIKVAVSKTKKA